MIELTIKDTDRRYVVYVRDQETMTDICFATDTIDQLERLLKQVPESFVDTTETKG